jgi:hypothetical protein
LKVKSVWLKACPIDHFHESQGIRRDDWGTLIREKDYGNRDSQYGWEIDHIVEKHKGGSDEIYNLRPLHWRNNLARNKKQNLSSLADLLTF